MHANLVLRLTREQNLFVLATRPGEETQRCGGLIAEACARGRPPVVAVLTDGAGAVGEPQASRLAAERERASRAAAAALGLPPPRLILFGVRDGTVPRAGPLFEALAAAVTFLMWSRDCGVIVAPLGPGTNADHVAATELAATVARRTGVELVGYGLGTGSARCEALPSGAWRTAKQHACALHGDDLDRPDVVVTPEFYAFDRVPPSPG